MKDITCTNRAFYSEHSYSQTRISGFFFEGCGVYGVLTYTYFQCLCIYLFLLGVYISCLVEKVFHNSKFR